MNTQPYNDSDAYYIIRPDGAGALDEAKYAYFDTDLVNDVTGDAFDLFRADPQLETARGVIRHGGRKLPGAFLFICANWLLVSKRARELFCRFEICPSIHWVPTRILNAKGRELATYYLAYKAAEHDIWDYALSDFSWIPGRTPGTSDAAGYMRKGVLDLARVPSNCDLFLARTVYWIVSQRLHDAIEDSGIEGFEFERI